MPCCCYATKPNSMTGCLSPTHPMQCKMPDCPQSPHHRAAACTCGFKCQHQIMLGSTQSRPESGFGLRIVSKLHTVQCRKSCRRLRTCRARPFVS